MASYDDGEVDYGDVEEVEEVIEARKLLEQLTKAYEDPATTKEQLCDQIVKTCDRFMEMLEHQVELRYEAEQATALLEKEVAAEKELLKEGLKELEELEEKNEQLKVLQALSRGAVTEARTQTEKDNK